MAQTSYTTQVITPAMHALAFERFALLLGHLAPLGLYLVSIIRQADGSYVITLNDPVPTAQLAHLGLSL